MAKTKEEITDIFAARLFPKNFQALTFTDFTDALTALSANHKTRVLDALLEGRTDKLGILLFEMMKLKGEANALTEAQGLMADDNLTLAELQIIYP